jgi:hypothetical protein
VTNAALELRPLPTMSATTRDVASSHAAARALLIAICLASTLLGRLCYLDRPWDSDGAMFAYQGKLVAEGGRLGQELIDNKFPTVGLMTSVCWRAFGANWVGYVALETALSLASALILARAAGRHFGSVAVLPTALFALVYLNFTSVVFGGFQLETIQVFFTTLAAAAALEALAGDDLRDAFIVGVAAGCAGMLKPTAAGIVLAIVLALCLAGLSIRRRLAHGAIILAGLAIPVSVSLAYLRSADLLHEMPQLAGQISAYARNSAFDGMDLLKPLIVAALVGFPFLVRGWVGRRDRSNAASNQTRRPDERAMLVFLVAWLAMEAIGVIAQRRMYAYHVLVLAPPCALLFGMIPRKLRLANLAAALAPMILLSAYAAKLTIADGPHARAELRLADALGAAALPGDRVWADDLPRVLLTTDLRPGSRVMLTFLFANDDGAPLRFSRMMLDDFARTRPSHIALPSEFDREIQFRSHNIRELDQFPVRRENYLRAWRDVRVYVEANYAHQERVGHYTIWKRK